MNWTRFTPRYYSGAGGDGDDDDDPDEPQLDGGDDGDDFPPLGRNFPGRFLPARELSLSVCFPPRRGGGSLSTILLLVLGFEEMTYDTSQTYL
jgi:hypothetical protein